ncbi:MAG: CrcB family protein [Acidobacteriota bacterium]
MIHKMALLVVAGAVGTLARYGTAGIVQKIYGASFPWGTMVVNLTGCFCAGFLWVLFENRLAVSGETRTIILVGFMGAFTTFSAFILETGELIRSAEWASAFANLAVQNVIGLVALFVGMALAKFL